MNSISNFIGQKLGFCKVPQIKSTRLAPDMNHPVNKAILSFLNSNSLALPPNIEKLFEIGYENEKILGILIDSHNFELAESFYRINPDIKIDKVRGSNGTLLLDLLCAYCYYSRWPGEGEQKVIITRFLEEILKNDTPVNLLESEALDIRPLDVLIYSNQIGLLHIHMENLLEVATFEDTAAARTIFVEIKESLSKGILLPNLGLKEPKDPILWKNYLSLLKAKYPQVFSDLYTEKAIVDRTVTILTDFAERFSIPQELYEEIALQNFLEESPRLGDLPIELLKSKVKIPQEDILKRKLIKLTTLSFQAYSEKSLDQLNNDQKKLCFKLIKEFFLQYSQPFNTEIKQKVISEIGQIKSFSESKIRKALKRAFD